MAVSRGGPPVNPPTSALGLWLLQYHTNCIGLDISLWSQTTTLSQESYRQPPLTVCKDSGTFKTCSWTSAVVDGLILGSRLVHGLLLWWMDWF
jgi:hypothetical protein